MDIKQLLKEFEYHLLYAKQVSNNTASAYVSDVEQFLKFCQSIRIKMEYVDDSIIEHFLTHVAASKQGVSINRLVSSLKSYFNYRTVTFKEKNPMDRLEYKQSRAPLPKTVYIHDIMILLESFKPNDVDDFHKLIVYILLGSGLRVSELTHLTFQNYYQNEGLFKVVGKGDKERWVPIYDKAKQLLDEYIENARKKWLVKDTKYLLINKKGNIITRQYVYTMVRNQATRAGLTIVMTPHTLRHGFATLLLANGADLRMVQELLGHSSISTTQIYTHIQPGKLHKSYDQFHPGAKISKEIKEDEKI
jgi:integrase/recombinase XerD